MDIWPKIRNFRFFKKTQNDGNSNGPSERELMIIGRLFVLFLIGISVAWIPIVIANQTGSLFVYVQMVSSYFQPPICAIYIMGLFMPKINEKGAFAALFSGLFLGIARMAMDMVFRKTSCYEEFIEHRSLDPRIPILQKDFPFLLYSAFLFVWTISVGIIISYFTNEEDSF